VLHASLGPILRSGYLTNALPEGGVPVGSALIRDYQDAFIKVKTWGTFESSDIENNGLKMPYRGKVPEFVAKFEQKLDCKPGLTPDVCCFLGHSFDADGSI
jgi:hypothetical protein